MPFNAFVSFVVLIWGSSIVFAVLYDLFYNPGKFIEVGIDLLKILLLLYGIATAVIGGLDFHSVITTRRFGSFWPDLFRFMIDQLPHAPGTSIVKLLFTLTGFFDSKVPTSTGIVHLLAIGISFILAAVVTFFAFTLIALSINALGAILDTKVATSAIQVGLLLSLLYAIIFAFISGFQICLHGDPRGIVSMLFYPALIYEGLLARGIL